MHIEAIRTLARRILYIVLLGALPLTSMTPTAKAQSKTARIGILAPNEASWQSPCISDFVPSLAKHGWTEGKNRFIEIRYAHGEDLSFTESAEELVKLKVDAISPTQPRPDGPHSLRHRRFLSS